MQGTGVKAPLPELSKPPGRLKKWRQDEKSRRKKEVKINVGENTIKDYQKNYYYRLTNIL
jgi:hypothetical protein